MLNVTISQITPEIARVHDEWGGYGPEQAGLEAVSRRLTSSRDDNNDPGTSLAHRTTRRRSGDVTR